MPYVRNGATRLTLPSDPSYWVELRSRVRYGDRNAAQRESTTRYLVDVAELTAEDWRFVVDRTDEGKALVIRQSVEDYNRVLLAQMIVDWNLDGEDGQVLPVTAESVDLLDDDDGRFLLEEVQKRMGRTQADEGPFVEPSLEPSTENGSSTQRPSTPSIASLSANSGTADPQS